MKRFAAIIIFDSENISDAIKKLEKFILRENNKIVLCRANDVEREIWYDYKE